MSQFFKTEEDYKSELIKSVTVDARSYNLGNDSIPLDKKNIIQFFDDFPQYRDFPLMKEILSSSESEQSDAVLSLSEYAIFVDNKAIIF